MLARKNFKYFLSPPNLSSIKIQDSKTNTLSVESGAKITDKILHFQMEMQTIFTKRNSCLIIRSYFFIRNGKTNYKIQMRMSTLYVQIFQ